MTTKKKLLNQIDPELQTYLDKIAAKYQPDNEVLQRHIDNAEARYNKYQSFGDIPARLVERLQSLILEGWRYSTTNPQPVMSNTSMLSVTLQKPEAMIEEELKALRSRASDQYCDQLFAAMEREIDELMHDAAQDAQQKAVLQAATDEAAMRDQLRAILGSVKV